MSLPRPVLPHQFYLITRRCTQRQFLLRPDPATNNAFTYCLIEAAQRANIDVLLPCAMSNGCGSFTARLDGRSFDHLTSLRCGRSSGSGFGTSPA